jgi:hypothetical protein
MRILRRGIGSSTKAKGLYALPSVSTTRAIGKFTFISRNLTSHYRNEAYDLSHWRKPKLSSRNISRILWSIVVPVNFRNRRACDYYLDRCFASRRLRTGGSTGLCPAHHPPQSLATWLSVVTGRTLFPWAPNHARPEAGEGLQDRSIEGVRY